MSSSNKKNNASARIEITVNKILAELNAFSKYVKRNNILTGSAAVYLYVYSLYLAEQDGELKKEIFTQLKRLPPPNDIDIIVRSPLTDTDIKMNGKIYKRVDKKEFNSMSESKGIPITRDDGLFNIDFIIDYKLKDDDLFVIEIDTKKITIVHPDFLLTKIYKGKRAINKAKAKMDLNSNSNSNLSNIKLSNEKKDAKLIKRNVLEQLNTFGLLPEQKKGEGRFSTITGPPIRMGLFDMNESNSGSNSSSGSIRGRKNKSMTKKSMSPLAMQFSNSESEGQNRQKSMKKNKKSPQSKKKRPNNAKNEESLATQLNFSNSNNSNA